MTVIEVVRGGSVSIMCCGRVEEEPIFFLRDLGKYSFWLGGKNAGFGVGGTRFIAVGFSQQLSSTCLEITQGELEYL